jgi:hydrogenase nickel incorporation protein HypA/HybF
MHELSLAVEMVRVIEEALCSEDYEQASRINVVMAAMSGVERSALQLVFPLAAEGTRSQGAELAIKEVPVGLHCRDCGADTLPGTPAMVCLACGSNNMEVSDDCDLLVESVEFV